jgi:hypothetical protein
MIGEIAAVQINEFLAERECSIIMIKEPSSGQWVNAKRVRAISLIMITTTLAIITYLFLTAKGTVKAYGRPLGTDFSNV